MRGKILIVDDEKTMCDLLRVGLSPEGFTVSTCTSAEEAWQEIISKEFDVLVTDLNMPGQSGIEFCKRVTENRPDIPVIVITAFGSLEGAISAIRAGAYDFITKPFDLEVLTLTLSRAVQLRALKSELKRLGNRASTALAFPALIGEAPP